jgi:PBP1b-binding outer membrane lipoprotein LpoB
MRSLLPLTLFALLAAGCSSNKSEENPQPEQSVQGSLDSAANRMAKDTMADSTHQDTSAAR